jgi:membrane protein DedA with SNARE-associated domain
MLEALHVLAETPLLLAVVLFGATLVAEDAATIAAGLLVSQTDASIAIALGSVIVGTAAGDVALYACGRWGAETRPGLRLRARSDVRRAEAWIARRIYPLVLAARFVPGLRLPIFSASGLVGARAAPIVAIILITTPLWSSLLFEAARRSGEAGAHALATVALGFVGLMLASFAARAAMRRRTAA